MPVAMNRRRFLATTSAGAVIAARRHLGMAQEAQSPTIDQRIRALAEQAPLAMRFDGTSAQSCREWQRAFGAKLATLLGPYHPPKKWCIVREDVTELDDHRREQLVLHADGVAALPIYLLVPRGKRTDRMAGVVAVHGHGANGYEPVAGRDDLPGVGADIERSNYDYGRQLVRRGYVVVAPCLTPFGRRLGDRAAYGRQDPCAVTFVRLQLLGKLLMAENLRDVLWSLEFLSGQPNVDSQRLACVGLSYGGRMTMLAAALEPRIRAAVISGALNVMQERIMQRYSCGAQVIPGLLEHGDTPEIASLIAPRPCLWEMGTRDGLISQPWADAALTRMRRAYRALGAEDRLHVDRFDDGHRWHGQRAYPLLDAALRS